MDYQTKLLAGIVGTFCCFLLGYWAWDTFIPSTPSYTVIETIPKKVISTTPSPVKKVWIQISGAVLNPGIYEVTANQRVGTVLSVAGGVLPTADLNRINLVTRIKDGKWIRIPFQKSKKNPKSHRQLNNKTPAFPIDLNQANLSDLKSIPGIGHVTAQRIISYRQSKGRFRKVTDILEVKGIGIKTLKRISGYLLITDS